MKKIIIFLILFLFIASIDSFAYEVGTHEAINDFVTSNSASLNTTLQNYGLANGFSTLIPPIGGKKISVYIEEGGALEDQDWPWKIRPMNHFHNPLLPWNESGFSDLPVVSYIDVSNPVWAQEAGVNQIWAQETGTSTDNLYSWPSAREYLYDALTATDENTRDANFINCFHSLGQVMHLVEDLAVPAHTRNDSHVWGSIYETWVDYVRQNYPGSFNDFLSNYLYTPDPSLFKTGAEYNPPNPYATIPIAGLFDADVYNGTNPDVTTGAVGMSEYTNANFFSENTIATGATGPFKYPNFSNTTTVGIPIPNPRGSGVVIRKYFQKTGDGDTGYFLATVGYLRDYVWNIIWALHNNTINPILQGEIEGEMGYAAQLDDNCYTDYASRLLPRAAGYSSALLQYFFRGQIDIGDLQEEVECPDENFNCPTWNVNTVTLSFKNSTPNVSPNVPENMDGTLEVYYKYRPVYGQGDFSSNTLLGSYKVSLPAGGSYQQIVIPNLSFSENMGGEAQYTLVFRGALGLESDAVVGRVMDFGFVAL